MDIEEVAKNTPEKVKTVPIDVMKGISSSTAKEIAQFLEFDASTVDQVTLYFHMNVDSNSQWFFVYLGRIGNRKVVQCIH